MLLRIRTETISHFNLPATPTALPNIPNLCNQVEKPQALISFNPFVPTDWEPPLSPKYHAEKPRIEIY